MGGYAGGDQASKLSVETIMDAFRSNTFEGPLHEDIPRDASDLARAICRDHLSCLAAILLFIGLAIAAPGRRSR